MRVPIRFAAVVLACVALLAARAAHADEITVTVSAVGSGVLGARSFTDRKVTTVATFSSQTLATCLGDCHPGPGLYELTDDFYPFQSSVSVAGVGTYGLVGLNAVGANAGELYIGSIDGFFSLNVSNPLVDNVDFQHSIGPFTGSISEPNLGDNCSLPDSDCPVQLFTSGGSLELSSVDPTATGEITVTSDVETVTPEPGTWVMVGTGLVGGVGAVRRRFSR